MTGASTNTGILHESVQGALQRFGIDCYAMPCDPALADTAAFCDHYKFSANETANCILVIGKTEPARYCCCVVLANSKLDVNKTVAQLMQVRRCSFASADQTLAVTGMEIGGVTPIGIPDSIPLYVDAAIMNVPRVVLGGGNRTSKILVSPEELKKAPGLTIVAGLGLPR